MDLQYSTRDFTTEDFSWLGNTIHLGDTHGATLLISAAVQAVHYPAYRIKPGTLVAQFTGGANSGLWAPFFNDWSDATNTGLDTATAVVIDGFEVRLDVDGSALSTKTAGSVLPGDVPQPIIVGNLPASVDEDETTAYTVLAADLPGNFYSIDSI